MYCEKCGADNSETAKFCRKCGELVEAEEETRVAVRDAGPMARGGEEEKRNGGDEEQEAEIFSISPTLMFVKAGYALAAVGALLLVAVTTAFTNIPTWTAVGIGLMLFLIPAFYHFRQKLVRYTLTDSKLEIDTGFVSRTTRNVPLGRIQDVTVSASVLQRLLGFGDIVIDNASDLGGKSILKNINTPKRYADELLRQMRDKEK